MSKWNLLRGRWGSGAGETDEIRIDASTNTIQTIEYEHHEIHSGNSYHAEAKAAGGSGTKATITFQTPDTTKYIHAFIHMVSNVEAQYTMGEGSTVTAASGTTLAALNRNRNILTATVVISEGTTGGDAAGALTQGATVTNFGTMLIDERQIGIGKTGGEDRGDSEWVLKRNTVYALEIESQATASEVSIRIDYYEHTDKH